MVRQGEGQGKKQGPRKEPAQRMIVRSECGTFERSGKGVPGYEKQSKGNSGTASDGTRPLMGRGVTDGHCAEEP